MSGRTGLAEAEDGEQAVLGQLLERSRMDERHFRWGVDVEEVRGGEGERVKKVSVPPGISSEPIEPGRSPTLMKKIIIKL